MSRRFTPTCVGTLRLEHFHLHQPMVHPHVRGDISHWFNDRVNHRGSPPRAWGHLPRGGCHQRGVRFTPTCVGTLPLYTPDAPGEKVHPHVRGDI